MPHHKAGAHQRYNAYVHGMEVLFDPRAPNILTIALKRFQEFALSDNHFSFFVWVDLVPSVQHNMEGGEGIYNLHGVIEGLKNEVRQTCEYNDVLKFQTEDLEKCINEMKTELSVRLEPDLL